MTVPASVAGAAAGPPVATQALRFPGGSGHELAARLELPPDGAARAYAVLAHCFTCGKSLTGLVRLSRALAAAGIGVLRFDFTGLGESEGEFAATGFASTVSDLEAAAAFLRAEFEAPTLLIGHSLGGTAAVRAALSMPEVRGVATINAPFEPSHALHLLEEARAELEARGEAEVRIADRPFRVRRALLDELAASRVDDAVRALDRPLLVLHAPGDRVVAVDEGERLFAAAAHPKSFAALPGADHLLRSEADAARAAALLVAWAEPLLPAPAVPANSPAPAPVVATLGSQNLTTTIRAGRHALVADEPTAVGGHDLGPTPYDLVSAGLAACTAMTLRLYAGRKGIPLERVAVAVTHDRVHAEDERRCADEPVRLDRLTRTLTLEGPLDDAQRARLHEIAARCPVHRTLEAGVVVRGGE